MSSQANKHRRGVEFQEGDMVLLKLQPYRQHSVARPASAKLGRRYYGPFRVTKKIGKVAYMLDLPPNARIHNVFHVSLLRPFVAGTSSPASAPLPLHTIGNHPVARPVATTASRTVLVNNAPQEQWKIRWTNDEDDEGTWEPKDHVQHHFPHVRLEDKTAANKGGVDMESMPGEEQPSAPAPNKGRPKRNRGPPQKYGDFV